MESKLFQSALKKDQQLLTRGKMSRMRKIIGLLQQQKRCNGTRMMKLAATTMNKITGRTTDTVTASSILSIACAILAFTPLALANCQIHIYRNASNEYLHEHEKSSVDHSSLSS